MRWFERCIPLYRLSNHQSKGYRSGNMKIPGSMCPWWDKSHCCIGNSMFNWPQYRKKEYCYYSSWCSSYTRICSLTNSSWMYIASIVLEHFLKGKDLLSAFLTFGMNYLLTNTLHNKSSNALSRCHMSDIRDLHFYRILGYWQSQYSIKDNTTLA